MKRSALARSFLFLAVALPLWASAARGEERTLSLPQAVEYALQHNGDIASLRDERGIREAGKVRAATLPNPTLDFEAATGALTGNSAENSLALGISQQFLLAGKREKRLKVADHESDAYRWQLAERERALSEEVKTAFYDVLLAGERVALAERSVALNRQLLEVARERLSAGDIPELELNLVKVELARSEGARIEAAKARLNAQAKLSALLGAPPDDRPLLAGALASQPTLKTPLAELQRVAAAFRPDVKALRAEKAKGEAEVVLARAEGVPDLTAGVVLSRDATTMEIGGVEGKDVAYTIGVRLSIPIPVFDRNRGAVQEAGARRNSSETRLAAAQRNVEREVEAAYATLEKESAVLSLYDSSVMPQLEENLKLTHEAYALGEVGILAVIEEQKKFYEVSDGYLTALHDRHTALVKLEAAVGSDLTGGAQ